MSENVNELLDQLKNSHFTLVTKPSAEQMSLSNQNINDYILQKAQTLVETGLDSVQSLKEVILSGGTPADIEAYAEVYKGVVGVLDTLAKLELQNKKAKTAKELKEMDIKSKKELPESSKGNTNILIATREEIFKNFIKQGEKIIEATYDEKPNEAEQSKK